MKTIELKSLLTAAAVLAALTLGVQNLQAQDFGGRGYGPGPGMFVDENGDGINDLAPDADGDGIPNGMDDDFVRPADGTGYGPGSGDGTGAGRFGHGPRSGKSGFGPGDGTGNRQAGPADGTGFGPGDCTGEGPFGNSRRGNPNR